MVFDGVETSKKNIAPFLDLLVLALFSMMDVCSIFVTSPNFAFFSGRSEVAKSFLNVLVKPPNFEHVEKSHLQPQTGLLHDRSAVIAQNKYGNLRVSRYPPNATFPQRNKA